MVTSTGLCGPSGTTFLSTSSKECCCDIFAQAGDTASILAAHTTPQRGSEIGNPPLVMLPAALEAFYPSKMPGWDRWYEEIQAEEVLLRADKNAIHYHRINLLRATALDEARQYVAFAYRYAFILPSTAQELAQRLAFAPNVFTSPDLHKLSPESSSVIETIFEHRPDLYHVFGGQTFLRPKELKSCNWSVATHVTSWSGLQYKDQLPASPNFLSTLQAEAVNKSLGPHKLQLQVLKGAYEHQLQVLSMQFTHIAGGLLAEEYPTYTPVSLNFSGIVIKWPNIAGITTLLHVEDQMVQVVMWLGSLARREAAEKASTDAAIEDGMPAEARVYFTKLEEGLKNCRRLRDEVEDKWMRVDWASAVGEDKGGFSGPADSDDNIADGDDETPDKDDDAATSDDEWNEDDSASDEEQHNVSLIAADGDSEHPSLSHPVANLEVVMIDAAAMFTAASGGQETVAAAAASSAEEVQQIEEEEKSSKQSEMADQGVEKEESPAESDQEQLKEEAETEDGVASVALVKAVQEMMEILRARE